MPIIEYDKDGQKFYSHTCWLSNSQRRAIKSIPEQNNKLCYYYSLAALTMSAICARKFSVIGRFYSSLGVYTGAAVITGGTFGVCKLLMIRKTQNEIKKVIEQNDSLTMPFWSEESKVRIIGERSLDKHEKVDYWKRLSGNWHTVDQLRRYNPDFILKHPMTDTALAKLNEIRSIASPQPVKNKK